MALLPGTRLGIYEITELIGAGGMGEVYRARDSRLNRDVAIKILPPDLSPSAEQLARFEREAQSLAALNHANIAHVYGVEETSSPSGANTRALVMEFVDGEDLAQRLRRGAIELDEALRIAVQIAHALEAAHDHGVIHRDLKPANIKVAGDGTVKLLDFGLAKAFDATAPAASAIDNSPTITSPAYMTRHGIVLGTAAYMSPEQARGQILDQRADLWAFGAVVYEMLTGTRAFPGDTVSDTTAAVLKSEPDWRLLSVATPHLVRRVLMKCLRKDVRERLADIRDARIDIVDAMTDGGEPTHVGHPPRRRYLAWGLAFAALLIGLAIGRALVAGVSRMPTPTLIRSSLTFGESTTMFGVPVISPNGRLLVFSATAPRAGLWLQRLDETSARFLPGTDRGDYAFWSPDSNQLGYVADGKLHSVHIESGAVKEIAAAPNFAGGAWGPSGAIVFASGANPGLSRVPATGGMPTPLPGPDKSIETAHRWPFFLSDATHYGYVSQRPGGYQLMVGSLDGGAPSAVTGVDGSVVVAPPDIILVTRGGVLFAHRLNLRDRTLSPDGVRIAEGVGALPSRRVTVSASSTGLLTYLAPRRLPQVRLAWVDRAGRVSHLPLAEGTYAEPALSPDGTKVALTIRDEIGAELWVYETDRGAFGRRTFSRASTFPIWSPDGRHLTFSRAVAQGGPLMTMPADGSREPEMLVSSDQIAGSKTATSWSADGKLLFFQNAGNVMVRSADGAVRPFLATPAREQEARFSPDGRWVAYRSDETGVDNVFVQPFSPGTGKWQISTDGGAQPMWAPSGRELFFIDQGRMMVVPIALEPKFTPGAPRMLFEIPMPPRDPGEPSRYAVSPDGKRFLVLTTDRSAAAPPAPSLHLISNWRALLPAP